MSLVESALALMIGVAYLILGAITFHELRRGRRERGMSRFGVALLLMVATCSPHHLAHAEHVLIGGHAANPLVTAALLIGAPAGIVFVLLRIEALLGGRGDRVIAGTPRWLGAAPVIMVFAAGVIVTLGVVAAVRGAGPSWTGLPSVALAGAYGVVGIYLIRAQLGRRGGRAWSLSGITLAAIFPTCALMHATVALSRPDMHLFWIDLIGVPVALYFLWVVNRLFRRALPDWNRRPLAGRPQAAGRPSPWAAPVAQPSPVPEPA